MLDPSSLVSLSLLALCIALLVSLRCLVKEVRTFRASFNASLARTSQTNIVSSFAPQATHVAEAAPTGAPRKSSFPPPQGSPCTAPVQSVSSVSPASPSVSVFSPPQGNPVVAAAYAAPVGAPLAVTVTQTPQLLHAASASPSVQMPQASQVIPAAHAAYRTSAPVAAPRQRESAESVIGRSVIGIIASALVFIGLIFLGFLVVPLLSDALKIALMFIISGAITAGGLVLVRRYPNSFTRILLGTGLGCFCISILLAHLWFHALSEVVAFSLLLVWTIVSLLIARQTKSMLIGIVAHAGMVVSVCAGYGAGLTNDRLVLLIVYQFLSTAVIVGGDILCFKRLYRAGLFTTLLLMLFASGAMWLHFWGSGFDLNSALPLPLVISAFVVQFAGATALAALLFVSCLRVADRSMGLLLQAANLVLWLLALFLDVALLVGRLAMMQTESRTLLSQYDTVPPMLIATLIGLGAALALIFIVRRMRDFDRSFEVLSVCLLVGAAVMALLVNYTLMYVLIEDTSTSSAGAIMTVAPLRLMWLLVPALLLLALSRFNYSKVQHLFATVLVSVELLCAFVSSFGEIERFVRELIARVCSAGAYVQSVGELSSSPLSYLPALAALVWLVLILGVAWLCYRLLPLEQRMQKTTRSTVTLSFAIALEAGVAFIIVITPELSVSSFLSLTLMLISFVIIMLGFKQRSSVLRVYGLVVVMVCVLKLVTFDISGLDTLMRVIAFIGGGIICFGISALYTFAVRRYNDAEKLSS